MTFHPQIDEVQIYFVKIKRIDSNARKHQRQHALGWLGVWEIEIFSGNYYVLNYHTRPYLLICPIIAYTVSLSLKDILSQYLLISSYSLLYYVILENEISNNLMDVTLEHV